MIFKSAARTAKSTHPISVIESEKLLLYREVFTLCSENHTKHIGPY
jgi:hypothetical protein